MSKIDDPRNDVQCPPTVVPSGAPPSGLSGRGSLPASAGVPAAAVDELARLRDLRDHVLAMADDGYLEGHPEWLEIVAEARIANGEEL